MIKNLINFLKGKDFLTQAIDEFSTMLDNSEKMFVEVMKKLLENINIPDLKEKLYKIDENINFLEKNIRKRIIEHLTFQPSIDVPACLLMMSVVKDAERLGDYSKNLYEVTTFLEKPIDKKKFTDLFGNMNEEVLSLHQATKDAFIDSDEKKASLAWDYERKIAKKCDSIIEEMAKSSLSVNEAVCFALIARYFKRLTAHLANIATSVILPISDLDYFDEKRVKERGR